MFLAGSVYSGDNPFIPEKKDKLVNDLKIARKEFREAAGFPLSLSIDLQLGIGSTSADVTGNSGYSYNTSSGLSVLTGALVNISIFDVFNFTTGISFTGKSFKVEPKFTNPLADVNTNPSTVINNMMNIPIYINAGVKLSEKIGLNFVGGPYLGIATKSDDNNTGLGFKNFDLGLNFTVTGSYKILPLTHIILGVTGQYGGLNNLGSTKTVDAVHTKNVSVFSGLRFAI